MIKLYCDIEGKSNDDIKNKMKLKMNKECKWFLNIHFQFPTLFFLVGRNLLLFLFSLSSNFQTSSHNLILSLNKR
jgi:hypothetical protein